MKATICSIIFIIVLASCNPCHYVAKHPECFAPDTIRETSTQTIRDTITWIQPDSMSLVALFYCDSANQVMMQTIEEFKSKGIKTRIIFKDNKLDLSVYTDSIKVLNRIISNIKSKEVYVMNPVNDKLKNDNIKLENRLHNRRWLLWYFIGSIVSIIVYIWIKIM